MISAAVRDRRLTSSQAHPLDSSWQGHGQVLSADDKVNDAILAAEDEEAAQMLANYHRLLLAAAEPAKREEAACVARVEARLRDRCRRPRRTRAAEPHGDAPTLAPHDDALATEAVIAAEISRLEARASVAEQQNEVRV